MPPNLNCSKCDELNRDVLSLEEWIWCFDCLEEMEDFIDIKNHPMRYQSLEDKDDY